MMTDNRCSFLTRNTPRNICECHKKLVQFGIPLYICEENDGYGEGQDRISYERAFRLPGRLEIDDELTEYLTVEENDLSVVFKQMAEVFPTLWDYEENVLSFWILDVLIEGLWTAQNAKMSFSHQKVTLMWIAYFFNFILQENPSRKQLFRHLKIILFRSEINSNEEEHQSSNESEKITNAIHWNLPLPPTVYRVQKEPDEVSKKFSEEASSMEEYQSEEGSNTLPSMPSVLPSENENERNLADMKTILEILYRIFARTYTYLQIQTVFNLMPSLELINLPLPLKIPKPLAKPEVFGQAKTERGGKKASISEKPGDDVEAERQLIKNNYILPLEVSEEGKEYLKQQSSERSALWRNREDRIKK